jgi:redox-regulated HSP33 family molecular chaperone
MGFYIAGIAALGAGLLVGGIVAAATGSAAGLTVAAVIAGAGVGTGGLSLWESRRFRRRAARLESTISEQRLFALAEKHGGTLQVLDVARGLGVMSAEAEALLDRLVDEVRVSMQVTDDGEIHYVFVELAAVRQPRIRVDVVETESLEESVAAESDSKKPLTA